MLLRHSLSLALEIAFVCLILLHSKLGVLILGKLFSNFRRDFSGILQHVVLVEFQKGVQSTRPIRHFHRDLADRLILRVEKILFDDSVQLFDFALYQIVFGGFDIGFENFALGRVFPGSQSHGRLRGVGARGDDLSRRLSGHRPVQFVLNRREETFGCSCVSVVVNARLFVEVGDLEVETAFARPNLTDSLEQLVEKVFSKSSVQLQPFVI